MALETLLVGVVVALVYIEIAGVWPGGIIVPGFFALSLDRPERAAWTLAAALLALGAYRLLARRFLLFGRRRFAVMLLLGAILAAAGALIWSGLGPGFAELRAVGWVVPGLIANQLARQKPLPTLAGLATCAVATHFLVRLGTALFG
ncbi:MAG: poly-gamma-glutamate biosynthesis protein PgsC [Candidatus Aminicenantes bacterium]|nr:poly-gamma-glutamate biosynthesis protein PgsC [Candidatus Aminicenantes bacterium]